MTDVNEAKIELDRLIPVVKAFTGTHIPLLTVTNPWSTRGLRQFKKENFTVLPSYIRLNEVGPGFGPTDTRIEDENSFQIADPIAFLLSSFSRAANFYDAGGKRQIIYSYKRPEGVLISVTSLESRKAQETSQIALLFDVNDPRFGLIADLVRVVRRWPPKQPPTEKSCSRVADDYSEVLVEIFSHLVAQIQLLDVHGAVVQPVRMYFLGRKKSYPVLTPQKRDNFLEVIFEALESIGKLEFDEYGKLTGLHFHSLESFRTHVGSLQKNLTPWTFGCDARCLFCYTDFGLGAIRYPGRWDRNEEEIEIYAEYYNPTDQTGLPLPIFSMQDWEPTRHENFLGIIKTISDKAPNEPIFIVTHGGLNESLIKALAAFPQLTLQISLNSSNVDNRELVMRPQNAREGIESLALCKQYGVKFDVSIVATPQWVGSQDIIDTIRFADSVGADYIRIALPTATKDHHPDLLLLDVQLAAIDRLAKAMRAEIKTPILVTVALLNETLLEAKVEGVIKDSLASKLGVRQGDVINQVNGTLVRSRTECNEILKQARESGYVALRIMRQGHSLEISATVNPSEQDQLFSMGVLGRGEKELGPLGILMPDDVDFDIFAQIKAICEVEHAQRPLILTSSVMLPFFKQALAKLYPHEVIAGLDLFVARNEHFGGNVVIAGLQTASDHIQAVATYINECGEGPDCLFISAAAYSAGGIDVTGCTFKAVENQYGIPVFLLRSRTGSY